MSRPYAEVIGDPIAHSKSPVIHNFWLGKLAIDAEYRRCHVRPEELADYVARRREDTAWRGCNVTIPHKEAMSRLVDMCDVRAASIGAVNTVMPTAGGTLTGTNTDPEGVAEAVAGINLTGRVAVVIGAGGAARSAFAFLAERRCAVIRVLARSPDKALKAALDCGLTADVLPFEVGERALADAGLVINATQLGMAGQASMPGFVLDGLSALAVDALVFDMVYSPLDTELLRRARSRNLRTADGLQMLVGQAATAFERFFGHPPPREHDAELRALLTS